MGIFDPKINTNIGYEQPVGGLSGGPSASGLVAIADAGVNALDSLFDRRDALNRANAPKQPSYTERKDARQNQLLQVFQNDLLKVQALRNEGRGAEADRLETTIATNAARHGLDLGDSNTEASYTAITGRDPKELLQSREQILDSQIRKSAPYEATYLTAPSDKTPEERHQWTLSTLARKEAQEQILLDQNIAWTEGKRDAFTSKINDFESTVFGVIDIVREQGGVVSEEGLGEVRLEWEALKRNLIAQKPAGVTPEQWGEIEAMFDTVKAQFDILERITSVESITADTARAIAVGIKNSGFTKGQKFIALNILNKDTLNAVIGTEAISYEELRGLTYSLVLGEFPEAELSNPSGVAPSSVQDKVTTFDSKQKLDNARGVKTLVANVDTVKLGSDSNYRKDYAGTLSVGLESMRQLGATAGLFTSAEQINNFFDGTLTTGIKEIAKYDPDMARNLSNQATKALAAQRAVAVEGVRVASQSLQSFTVVDGKVEFDQDKFNDWLNTLGSLERQGIQKDINSRYGGSAEEFVRDGGSQSDWGAMVSSEFNNIRGVQDQINAITAMDQARTRFSESALVPKEGQAEAVSGISGANIRGWNLIENDTEFLQSVNQVSSNLGIDPNWLLANMSFETAGSFSPSIRNPTEGSTATGLIQFVEKTAKRLGTTTSALAQMDRIEQMQWVEKYLKPYKGRMNNIGDVYMAIHWPAAVGKKDSYVMYEKGSLEYSVNTTLDMNKDGTITRGEAVASVIQSNKGGSYVHGRDVRFRESDSVGTYVAPETAPVLDVQTEAPNIGLAPAPSVSPSRDVEQGFTGSAPQAFSDPPPLRRAFAEGSEGRPEQPGGPDSSEPGRDIQIESEQAVIDNLFEEGFFGDKWKDYPSFKDEDSARSAIRDGVIGPNDVYIVGDKVYHPQQGRGKRISEEMKRSK